MTNFTPPEQPETQINMRRFGDHKAARNAIFDNALTSVKNLAPAENTRYKLHIEDLGYTGKDSYTPSEEKKSILSGQTLARRLTGNFVLTDKATGNVVDQKRTTVAHVPYLTDRGAFIIDGNQSILASQIRLDPGIYTRRKQSGQYSSHINVPIGGGQSHTVEMDPASGVFKLHIGQAQIPAVALLRTLGVTDDEMKKAWGEELFRDNDKATKPHHIDRMWEKFGKLGQVPENKQQALKEIFEQYKLDPWTTKRTLGKSFENYGKDAAFTAINKLLRVARGEEQPDDRDSMAYASVWAPEHLIKDRLDRSRPHLNQMLWQATNLGSLQRLHPGVLNPAIRSLFLGSGLAIGPEGVHATEFVDHGARITKTGAGGLGKSADAMPRSSRDVSASQLPFIDLAKTSECHVPGTQIMTFDGWKPIESVTYEDKIACVVDDRIAFHNPEKVHEYDFEGTLYGAKNRFIEYLVTPTHRFLVAPTSFATAKFRWSTAKDVHETRVKHKIGGFGAWIGGHNRETFSLPKVEAVVPAAEISQSEEASRRFRGQRNLITHAPFDYADFSELLGWYLGEGCVFIGKVGTQRYSSYSTKISQSPKVNPENCVKIRALLSRLGLSNSQYKSSISICGKQITSYFAQFGYSKDRFIPQEFMEAGETARKRLFDALMDAEGSVSRQGYRYVFNTTSGQMADQFVKLAFSLGKTVTRNLKVDNRKESYLDLHQLLVHQNTTRSVMKDSYYTQEYKGKVHCVTVPGGMIFTKYGDGNGFWNGNSGSVGVDLRVAFGTRVGSDNRIYAPVRNARTGKIDYVNPRDLADATVAFPGGLKSNDAVIPVISKGKMVHSAKHLVDYEIPTMEQSFSPLTNLVPLKSASKAHRASMGARFVSQALPVVSREAPLVRNAVPGLKGVSFEELYGRHAGTAFADNKPGVVTKVDPEGITIKYEDGTDQTHNLYNNFPAGRFVGLHSIPTVREGDPVAPGQIISASNHTDDKGHLAYGLNARVGFLPYIKPHHGISTYEDSIGISKSFAKRMTSDHLLVEHHPLDDTSVHGKHAYLAAFPGKHELSMLKKYDEDGAVKVGQVVKEGEPLVLSVKRRQDGYGTGRSMKAALVDDSTNWEHEDEGVVTDVVKNKDGIKVIVSTKKPMRDGDKLCFDPETEILTETGWKNVADIILSDKVATLVDGNTEYLSPVLIVSFAHRGRMYRVVNERVDLLVTDNHKLYVDNADSGQFALTLPDEVYGRHYAMTNESGERLEVNELGSDDYWVEYEGNVHCVTMPKSHIIYARRNGKPVWVGQSGTHGNKGVVQVIPDELMPLGEDGRPLEAIFSSLGLTSRINSSHVIASALGKVAEKTGNPYVINDFSDHENLAQFALRELQKHGLKDKENLFDPETGQTIPGVATGNLYLLKLHHIAEKKVKGRGALGATDPLTGAPMRGQSGKASRMSLGDTQAIVGHSSGNVISDLRNVRGQSDANFWLSFMSGHNPGTATANKSFERFLEMLKGAGVHPVRQDGKIRLMGLTQKTLDELAPHEIKNSETLDFGRNGEPIEGGLFSKEVGGPNGCFSGNVTVWTENGLTRIRDIVKNRMQVKVWSYDFTSATFVLRPVVNWFTNRTEEGIGESSIQHYASFPNLDYTSRSRQLHATRNHLVYTSSGQKIPISEADHLQIVTLRPTRLQESVLVGTMLGDATVRSDGAFVVGHSRKYLEYAKLKRDILDSLGATALRDYVCRLGNKEYPSVRFGVPGHAFVKQMRKDWYVDGEKIIPDYVFDDLDPVSLAFWYMDDGSINQRGPKGAKRQSFRITLHVQGFRREYVERLSRTLFDKWGIVSVPFLSRATKDGLDKGYTLRITGDSVIRFLETVAPYIEPVSMGHKLLVGRYEQKRCQDCGVVIGPSYRLCTEHVTKRSHSAKSQLARNSNDVSPISTLQRVCGSKLSDLLGTSTDRNLSLAPVPAKWSFGEKPYLTDTRTVYDIEVADTHNYFANGVLVSNSGWGKAVLHEPHLNPIFEEPARKLLNLTEAKFRDIIADRADLNGKKGMSAIREALSKIDLDKEIDKARQTLETGSNSSKDLAARQLSYLKGAKTTGIHPKDWFLSAMPVLPPIFRPIRQGGGGKNVLVGDYNILYKDLIEINQAVNELKGKTENLGDEKLGVYDAMKAIAGLDDPISEKNAEKGVGGILQEILGKGGSKTSLLQQKLLGNAADLSGRGTILPGPHLSMDHIGLPEELSWDVFKPHIVRNLVRQGYPNVQALKMATERDPVARKAMLKEMEDAVVTATRYPALHKYNVMAFHPVLAAGSAINLSPLTTKAYSGDFDGDEQFNGVIVLVGNSLQDQITSGSLSVQVGHSDSTVDENYLRFREMSGRFNVSVVSAVAEDKQAHVIHLADFPRGKEICKKGHITRYEVPDGVYVVAYDDVNNSPILAKVSEFSVHEDREIELVNLRSGRQIVSDDDERAVYGLDTDTYEFVRRRPSESIGLQVPSVDNLTSFYDGHSKKQLDYTTSGVVPTTHTIVLDEAFGYICGSVAGDGWVSGRDQDSPVQLHLAAVDTGVQSRFKECIALYCGEDTHISTTTIRTGPDSSGYGRSTRLTLSRASMARLFHELVGRKAQNKHLPPFFLSGDENFRLNVLAGLLDTDGSISFSGAKAKKQLLINFTSTSLRLIQETQHLCRSLGIRSTITATKTPAGAAFWLLNLSTPDVQKTRLADYICHSAKRTNIFSADTADITKGSYLQYHRVPISSEIADTVQRAAYKKYKITKDRKDKSLYDAVTRSKADGQIARYQAKAMCEEFGSLIKEKLPVIYERFLAVVNDESTVWDRVVSFEKTGIKKTGYDLSVPGYETFMSTDGIILSNTMSIHVLMSEKAKQDALEKMLPSKNLISPADNKSILYGPNMEFTQGLYEASTGNAGNAPLKVTREQLNELIREGKVRYDTQIELVDNSGRPI